MSLADRPIGSAITDTGSGQPVVMIGSTTTLTLTLVNNSGKDVAVAAGTNPPTFVVRPPPGMFTRAQLKALRVITVGWGVDVHDTEDLIAIGSAQAQTWPQGATLTLAIAGVAVDGPPATRELDFIVPTTPDNSAWSFKAAVAVCGEQMYLDILDVGQGEGMVLWLPNGKVMMVDYGSTKNKRLVQRDSFSYFRDHTPFANPGQVLEWLVLTHGDRDHYNMVEDFLREFQVNVRNVLYGGREDEYGGKLIDSLRKRRNPNGKATTVQTSTNRGFFPLAPREELGAEVMVLACGVTASGGDTGYVKNTRSVVLRITYRGVGLMLTGDATHQTELQIIGALLAANQDPAVQLGAHVLKVAHHGSHRTSSHAAFLRLVNPDYAFISSDRSGTLDEAQRTRGGYRLPQALTIDLLRKYAPRLRRDCVRHPYVMSYQKTDYESYNRNPDIRDQRLELPATDSDVQWIEHWSSEGIFSTLAKMGISNIADDEGAADIGVQYRLAIGGRPSVEILVTDDFARFDRAAAVDV